MLNRNHNHDEQDQPDPEFLQDLVSEFKAIEPEECEYIRAQDNLLQKLAEIKEESIMSKIIKPLFSSPLRLTTSTGTAALFVVMLIIMNPFGDRANNVYAQLAEQLRNARTIAFSAEWFFGDQTEPTKIEMAFREPGIQRTEMEFNGARMVQINDTANQAGIIMLPDMKVYYMTDLRNMPSLEQERLGLLNLVQKDLQNLPTEAEVVFPIKTIEGQKVQGFKIGEIVIWINDDKQIVLLELNLGATKMLLKNFRIDPADLDDRSFALEAPEGYQAINPQPLVLKQETAQEQDLIQYLKGVCLLKKDRQFPKTTNPIELLELRQGGFLIDDVVPTTEAEQKAKQQQEQEFAQSATNAVYFVTNMKQENDWNYAGEGVKFGDGQTPVAWWKPENSETYRVIWGNLKVTDETSQYVAEIKK